MLRAFSLVEVLVVLSIIAILSSLGMTVLTSASAAAKRSASSATMSKLDTAVRLFKADFLVFPYQNTYPDDDLGWTNRLAYTVGSRIADEDRVKVQADMEAAAAQYAFTVRADNCYAANPPVSVHAYRPEDVVGEGTITGAIALNRMAQERVRLMVLSGDCRPMGVRIRNGRDNSATPVLNDPQSADKPGWAIDYLAGEIPARFVDGETVLDGWKRPLIYIARIAPAMRPSTVCLFRQHVYLTDPARYGLGDSARNGLTAIDPITRTPLAADGERLPDPSNLRHSDRRYWAAPGYENDIELWSAGRDGRFAAMRDAGVNADNIGNVAYDRGL